jgi:hypothetical protein
MKRIHAISLLAAAGFIAAKGAAAQPQQQGHYLTIQYVAPPVPVMTLCNVRGVNYPIDYNYQIWGVNNLGQWFTIGQIVSTPAGTIAVRNDGARFPASCE